jgi:sugar-specific transcriptional regulator TrmB
VGKKEDGTAYTKKDEAAFQRLADRIQLSLKFILAYEEILKKQYNRQLEQKNKAIRSREETIHQLQEQIDQLQEELRLVTKTEESP